MTIPKTYYSNISLMAIPKTYYSNISLITIPKTYYSNISLMAIPDEYPTRVFAIGGFEQLLQQQFVARDALSTRTRSQ